VDTKIGKCETETVDSLGFQRAPAAVRVMAGKAVGTGRERGTMLDRYPQNLHAPHNTALTIIIIITTIKRTSVGEAASAMSHAAAAAAGYRAWHGYRLAANSFYSPSAPLGHWQWSSLLNVNDDQSAQRDKSLDESRGEATIVIQIVIIH